MISPPQSLGLQLTFPSEFEHDGETRILPLPYRDSDCHP